MKLENETYRRMDDVELVLRFFAYRFVDILTGTVEDFLDDYLKNANAYPEKTLEGLEKLFNDTIDTAYGIFGEEAFFSPKYERKMTKPQKTIYDPLMQSIAKCIESKDKLIDNADLIRDSKYENATEIEGDRLFYGRNTSSTVVKTRIEYFDNLLTPYL